MPPPVIYFKTVSGSLPFLDQKLNIYKVFFLGLCFFFFFRPPACQSNEFLLPKHLLPDGLPSQSIFADLSSNIPFTCSSHSLQFLISNLQYPTCCKTSVFVSKHMVFCIRIYYIFQSLNFCCVQHNSSLDSVRSSFSCIM